MCGRGSVVEHHLAKVRVAGSNPVVRSVVGTLGCLPLTVEWPRGEAAACKAVYTGSNPVSTSHGAIGAAVARFPDTEEVTGSIPVSPTSITAGQRLPAPPEVERQPRPATRTIVATAATMTAAMDAPARRVPVAHRGSSPGAA